MKIKERMVQRGEKESLLLRKKNFAVNMRLFKTCEAYREIISGVIRHMRTVIDTDYDDYSEVRGVSGANVGIPFRIILIRKKNEYPFIMINPIIVGHSKKQVVKESNCGSINLEDTIKVKRYCWIKVEYYNGGGSICTGTFGKNDNTFTIQHEIDHINGDLITDKEV